jgi:hypothetical protein
MGLAPRATSQCGTSVFIASEARSSRSNADDAAESVCNAYFLNVTYWQSQPANEFSMNFPESSPLPKSPRVENKASAHTSASQWRDIQPKSGDPASVRALAKGALPQTKEQIRECVAYLLSERKLASLNSLIKVLNSKGLDLSGMDIKYKGDLRSLAEALHDTTVEELCLADCGLDDEDGEELKAFFSDRSPAPSIKKLDLSSNQLGSGSAKAIRAGLAGNTTLIELDLSENKLGAGSFVEIMRAFTQPHDMHPPQGSSSNAHGPENQTLQTIRFDNNKHMFSVLDTDGKDARRLDKEAHERSKVEKAIAKLSFVKNPTRIGLANTRLPANHSLVKQLLSTPGFPLAALDLSNNPYHGDKAILELVNCIRDSSLQNLELSCRSMRSSLDTPHLNTGEQFLWLAHQRVSMLDLTGTVLGTHHPTTGNDSEEEEPGKVVQIHAPPSGEEAKQMAARFCTIHSQARASNAAHVHIQTLKVSNTCAVARVLSQSQPRLPFSIELELEDGNVQSINPPPTVFHAPLPMPVASLAAVTTATATTTTTTASATGADVGPETAPATGATPRLHAKPPLTKRKAQVFDKAKLPKPSTSGPTKERERNASKGSRKRSSWGAAYGAGASAPGTVSHSRFPSAGLGGGANAGTSLAGVGIAPRFLPQVSPLALAAPASPPAKTSTAAAPALANSTYSTAIGATTGNPAPPISVDTGGGNAPRFDASLAPSADAPRFDASLAPPADAPRFDASLAPPADAPRIDKLPATPVTPNASSPMPERREPVFAFFEGLGVNRQSLKADNKVTQFVLKLSSYFDGDDPIFKIEPSGELVCNRLPAGRPYEYGPLLAGSIAAIAPTVCDIANFHVTLALSVKMAASNKFADAAMTLETALLSARAANSGQPLDLNERTKGRVLAVFKQCEASGIVKPQHIEGLRKSLTTLNLLPST